MSLSGGQKQQRLFITRALAMHNAPEVLLMDKPASALDHRAS
jgi:ABC-type phosphate transport system ATPase subunit